MADRDYYQILGVGRAASREEIRKAYRRLARSYHPDLKPGDKSAEEKFKVISLAYEVLGDPDKRKLYDEFGDVGLTPGFNSEQARASRSGYARSSGGFEFHAGDFSDLFNLADFQNLFAGGGRFAEQGVRRGEDIESEMEVDFLDAVRGFQANLSIQRPISCRTCGGAKSGANSCSECRGSGRVMVTENVRVNIPAGAESSKRIRVTGKGGEGQRGAPPGDLYIKPRVRSHPLFSRTGRDLTMDLPISIGEAVRGASIKVPTPMGAVEVKVPACAQSGQLLRVKGKGVQGRDGNHTGDLYLRLLVRVPKSVVENEIIEQLEKSYGENIRQDLTL